jgi:hypothetical protein
MKTLKDHKRELRKARSIIRKLLRGCDIVCAAPPGSEPWEELTEHLDEAAGYVGYRWKHLWGN